MIPVSTPWVTDDDRQAVNQALAEGFLAGGGGYVGRFEQAWASYCGRKHGVAVTNGTAALELAVYALGLPAGSEVILPDFTIISCARAVVVNGLKPVFVDADPYTWTMDVSRVEEVITKNTSAIMPVHMYGHPVDMQSLMEIAARHDLVVIEDAAEVHGAHCRGQRCGSFGEISTFSFYANKIVTTGEGGMVVFDDDALLPKCHSYREYGFSPERRFMSVKPGGNYRFTAMQAAIGLSQINRIDEVIQRKKDLAARYNEHFSDVEELVLPPSTEWGENVYWMYGLVLSEKTELNAEEIISSMKEQGIETRPFFLGMHEQPVLQHAVTQAAAHFPVCRRLSRKGFYLPSGVTLTADEIDAVACALKQALVSCRI